MIKKFIPLKIKIVLKIIMKYFLTKKNNYLNKKNIKKINNKNFMLKNLQKINSIDELINFHFDTYSTLSHINKDMFTLLLKNFSNKSLNILETGSAAHGSKSSMLFASYILKFGGRFDTVDINSDIKKFYKFIDNDMINFHTNDSVEFIKKLNSDFVSDLHIVYLDSAPLDLKNPHSGQNHCLNEFLLIDANIKQGTLIAIDDTPKYFELWGSSFENTLNFVPGNGRYVLDYINKHKGKYEILYHHYSVVLKKL